MNVQVFDSDFISTNYDVSRFFYLFLLFFRDCESSSTLLNATENINKCTISIIIESEIRILKHYFQLEYEV